MKDAKSCCQAFAALLYMSMWHVTLLNDRQGISVDLVASATISSPSQRRPLPPLEFRALVRPSRRPSVLRMYQADNLGQPLPIDDDFEDLTFTLVQEAGTQVNSLQHILDALKKFCSYAHQADHRLLCCSPTLLYVLHIGMYYPTGCPVVCAAGQGALLNGSSVYSPSSDQL